MLRLVPSEPLPWERQIGESADDFQLFGLWLFSARPQLSGQFVDLARLWRWTDRATAFDDRPGEFNLSAGVTSMLNDLVRKGVKSAKDLLRSDQTLTVREIESVCAMVARYGDARILGDAARDVTGLDEYTDDEVAVFRQIAEAARGRKAG